MPVYNGNNEVHIKGIYKGYFGNQLIYRNVETVGIWINGNTGYTVPETSVSVELTYINKDEESVTETITVTGWHPKTVNVKKGSQITARISGVSIIKHYDSTSKTWVEDKRDFEGRYQTYVSTGDPNDPTHRYLIIQRQTV